MATATHPEYESRAASWTRARDVVAGEDAVKAAGEKYLPRLDSQSAEEYAAYKTRASFFSATAQTLKEYLELIFRRRPALEGCDGLEDFKANCDGCGTDLVQHARAVVREVLTAGHAGTLVLLWPGRLRPAVSLWTAEQIVDWTFEQVDGRRVLSRVVLRDGAVLREFALVRGACLMTVRVQGENGWTVTERRTLHREGDPVPFVPFVFHCAEGTRPEAGRLPLADLIAANLDHYRLDADYKHGLHFAALPTAWVSGFDKASPLRIGSSTAWVSEVPGASAGFLEFSGAGLAHLERAIEKVEKRMAVFGARMLEAGEEGSERGGQQLCGLGEIVGNLNKSLSRVLQMALWWGQGGELEALSGKASYTMNTDLAARTLSGEALSAVVAAWKSGAISRETMLECLRRGEVLPDGRTVAQERALIHGKARLNA